MLVVTRRVGEGILIGDNIRVVLTRSKHGSAGIGIEAPQGVRILREEIRDQYSQVSVETGTKQGEKS